LGRPILPGFHGASKGEIETAFQAIRNDIFLRNLNIKTKQAKTVSIKHPDAGANINLQKQHKK
jgi:hypothetical protein